MGDIEAMFHQVRVSKKHRDVLRFLWWKDGSVGGEIVTFRMNVYLFDGVWSPSCATYALQRTAKDNENDFSHQVCDTVKKNFYVDDCLKSVPNVTEAKSLVSEVSKLPACGGFRLTKWVSNNKEVLSSIPEKEWAKGIKDMD